MAAERRFTKTSVPQIEEREGVEGVISGYAAVFHVPGDERTEYQLFSDVTERIAAGAFDRAITEGDDARALFNHNPDQLLGRVAAGTLRLSVDRTGLRYEIDVPATQVGQDVAESIRRGDLAGSSFAFHVEDAEWVEGDRGDVREIRSVRLVDVGPVTYPAYEGTTTGTRAAEESYQRWHESLIVEANPCGKAKRARWVEIVDR